MQRVDMAHFVANRCHIPCILHYSRCMALLDTQEQLFSALYQSILWRFWRIKFRRQVKSIAVRIKWAVVNQPLASGFRVQMQAVSFR